MASTDEPPPSLHDDSAHLNMPSIDESPPKQAQATTITGSSKSYQAAHAVLNTNELLCEIIGYLPLKDIVVSTGVCHTWRKALKSNTAIQQALYLAPADMREVLVSDTLIRDTEMPVELDKCHVIGELHPCLHRICGCIWPDVDYSGCKNQPLVSSLIHTFEHPDGIWRDMFVTQPPRKAVYIQVGNTSTYRVRGIMPPIGAVQDAKHESGVKMGELYDFIHSQEPQGETVLRIWGIIGDYAVGKGSFHERYNATRCKVSNGVVSRPAQIPDKPEFEPDTSSDDNSDDSNGFDDEERYGWQGGSDFEYDEGDSDYAVEDEDDFDW